MGVLDLHYQDKLAPTAVTIVIGAFSCMGITMVEAASIGANL